jgi:hypothetical protein
VSVLDPSRWTPRNTRPPSRNCARAARSSPAGRYLVTPAVVAGGFLLLYLAITARELGGIEQRVLTWR